MVQLPSTMKGTLILVTFVFLVTGAPVDVQPEQARDVSDFCKFCLWWVDVDQSEIIAERQMDGPVPAVVRPKILNNPLRFTHALLKADLNAVRK